MNEGECYRASLRKGDLLAQEYVVPWTPIPVKLLRLLSKSEAQKSVVTPLS